MGDSPLVLPYSLEEMGLPPDYGSELTTEGRKLARKAVLTSWYDPKKPHILCNDVHRFVQAHKTWSEFYLKPAKCNQSTYYWSDPVIKYDITRKVMGPSPVPTEPTKTLISAPRRICKTQSVLIECGSLVACCRPRTGILVVEYNATRNEEEIKKILSQVEDNDRIHADFGGVGRLYPRKSSPKRTWNSERLDFLNGSYIAGHSINSAQRGRGPLWGILDDPEPEDLTRNKAWRAEFFRNLFGVFLPMFHYGGKITWIGTPIHLQSCLNQALKGLSEKDEETPEDRDTRFDDWLRFQISMIQIGPNGEEYSIQPERLSVEAAEHKKKALGIQAYMAEIQGIPIQPGQFAFTPDEFLHHYMHCVDSKGEEYFLDLKTGEKKPWQDWLKSLIVYGAMDVADGQSVESDPGAIILIGIAPNGSRHVLDAFNKRCFAELLVDAAIILSQQWNCPTFGVEKVALQTVVSRLMRNQCLALNQEGKFAPRVIEVPNYRKNKIQRVLTLTPYFTHHQIRFLRHEDLVMSDGVTHRSVPTPSKQSHRALMEQVLSYTDEGVAGPDDAIDCLEMALRISQLATANPSGSDEGDDLDKDLASWNEAGFSFGRHSLPVEQWTEKMWKERNQEVLESVDLGEYDSY